MRAVDLIRFFGDADRRPDGGRFELREQAFRGRSMPAVVTPANSRITWTLFVPHRGRLTVHAGVPDSNGPAAVAFRVGISDNRIYDTLLEQTVTSDITAAQGWLPLTVDLSRYAGRKWSLFYRPDDRRWRIVLGTRIIGGAPGSVYLGEPAIDTDVAGAREYAVRVATRSPR